MFGAMGTIRKENLPRDFVVKKLYPKGFSETAKKELDESCKDPNRLYLIGDMYRLGVKLLSVRTEYTYFSPRRGKNDLFELIILKWPDSDSLMWSIISMPMEYHARIEELAKQCGLRFANGIPTIFNSDGVQQFPIDGSNVYTLENTHNHTIYTNKGSDFELLKRKEEETIEAIVEEDLILLKEEMKAKGYSDRQIKRIIEQWEEGNNSYDEKPESI